MGARFVQLSATSSGVSEVRDIMRVARNDKTMLKRQTILFIDEIHQFNKLQQVSLHTEDRFLTLCGRAASCSSQLAFTTVITFS